MKEVKSMFDYTWIIAVVSIIGTIANVYQKRWCFIIWTITNGFWAMYDLRLGLYSQATIYIVYLVLAIWGLLKWSKENKTDQPPF